MTIENEHDRLDAEIRRRGPSSDPFASAVRATRMPMLITDPSQPDNPIIFSNDAFSKLTGYSRAEIQGQNCRFLQGAETNRDDIARLRSAIDRRVTIEIELLNYKKSGERFWNRLLVSPVFDADGQLTYFFASQFDVTLEREKLVRLQDDRDALEQEMGRRTEELRQAEARLHFTVKAGRLGTWTLDLADQRLVASEICKDNFGRKPSDPFTYADLASSIFPEDQQRMQEAVAASIENRTDYDIEYRVVVPSGEIRWVNVRGQTFYRADGTPMSMAGVSIDVTERKRGEEHRTLLAAELTHRVKNSMATMQSIARQTLKAAPTVEDALERLDARLLSLSAAHDVLTRENWEGATLSEIVNGAIGAFRSQAGRRFSIGGPDLRLSPRAALSFSMALHELATNAAKYGALSNEAGRVIINWDMVGGSASDRLWLRWEELNGPPVVPPGRKGFGTRLIERALPIEIGGQGELEYRPRGVVFTIEAPLANVQTSGQDLFRS